MTHDAISISNYCKYLFVVDICTVVQYNLCMHSSSTRDKVLSLRRNKYSYKQIAKMLNLSKSTISYWLVNNPESERIKEFLIDKNLKNVKARIGKLNEANRARWEKLRKGSVELAEKEFVSLWDNPLFVAGINIYWGEGDSKEKNPLRIANTDSRMIKVYCKFLTDIMKVPKEKIRLWILLCPDLNDEACKGYWQKISGMGEENFVKSQHINGRHKVNRLEYGVCNVVVNSRYEKLKMLAWIDLFAKKITI